MTAWPSGAKGLAGAAKATGPGEGTDSAAENVPSVAKMMGEVIVQRSSIVEERCLDVPSCPVVVVVAVAATETSSAAACSSFAAAATTAASSAAAAVAARRTGLGCLGS